MTLWQGRIGWLHLSIVLFEDHWQVALTWMRPINAR